MWRQVREIVWGPRRGRRRRRPSARLPGGRSASLHSELLEVRRLLSATTAPLRDLTTPDSLSTPVESLYLVQFDNAALASDMAYAGTDGPVDPLAQRWAEPQWLT